MIQDQENLFEIQVGCTKERGGTSDKDKEGDTWTTTAECCRYVKHRRSANDELMREVPEAIPVSQQPPNILTVHVPGDFSIRFSR